MQASQNQGMFPRGGMTPTGNIAGGTPPTGLPGMQKKRHQDQFPGTLNPQSLAQVDAATQKQMIGETLYPLVQQRITKTECAGKITGMILEMDNTEVLMLFDNQDALNEKIGEACSIIGQGCELIRQF